MALSGISKKFDYLILITSTKYVTSRIKDEPHIKLITHNELIKYDKKNLFLNMQYLIHHIFYMINCGQTTLTLK